MEHCPKWKLAFRWLCGQFCSNFCEIWTIFKLFGIYPVNFVEKYWIFHKSDDLTYSKFTIMTPLNKLIIFIPVYSQNCVKCSGMLQKDSIRIAIFCEFSEYHPKSLLSFWTTLHRRTNYYIVRQNSTCNFIQEFIFSLIWLRGCLSDVEKMSQWHFLISICFAKKHDCQAKKEILDYSISPEAFHRLYDQLSTNKGQ